MLSQGEDEQGKPLYPQLPPGLRCVFRKRYPDGKPPVEFFVSTLELYLGSAEGKTPLEKFREAVAQAPENVLTAPKEMTLGNTTWAVCEIKASADAYGVKVHSHEVNRRAQIVG